MIKTAYVTIFAVLFVSMIVSIVQYLETRDGFYQALAFVIMLVLFNGTGKLMEILKGDYEL